MNDILLQADHVSKSFGTKKALQDFSIAIPKGSIYGLLGPNGAGKTTFLRILNQISYPDSGELRFNGEKLSPKHIAQIGYMPEERGLYKNMKVGEQAIYLAQLKGLSKKEAKEKLVYWFKRLNIGSWWNKKLSELSKGMGQKIQFIVTILHEPQLIIFDEPFSGFDPVNANIIRDEILALKEQGTTIIFSTHRMESVEEMCDYVALMNKSKKILDGEINAIRNEFKQGLLAVNLSDVNLERFENFKAKHHLSAIKTRENKLSFELLAQDDSQNKLIEELSTLGEIKSFTEVIPSMNEIFIKAVNN